MIDFHYTATPNGQKVAIMLEECGLPYRVLLYDIFAGDQLTPEFGRINPNHKLPAIVDHDTTDGTAPVTVFESGAILRYLAEKAERFLATKSAVCATTLSWLTWQVAGLGPMGGQASHFLRYAPAGQDYAVARYTQELDRLLAVLEHRLGEALYVAGDDYSIADMAIFPGRAASFVLGRGLDEYPNTHAWFERVRARPAVDRAMTRPDLVPPSKYMERHQNLDATEWSNMFGERMLGAVKPR